VNDEMRELQARLERATSRGNVGSDALDAETAALREGWLALGQVLESAETGLASSFEKRCREKAGTGSLPAVVSPTLPPTGSEPVPISLRRRRAGLLPLLIAAAVIVLVAATIAWQSQFWPSPDGAGATPGPMAKTAERPTPKPQEAVVPAPPEKPAAIPSAVEIAWDDSLDSEIASVGRAVVRVDQEWHALADASSAVQYQLQQLSQEFGDK
jgi:hypothetical protein